MPTWEALPSLLSEPDASMPPAHFGRHLSKNSQELTPGIRSGQLPYPRACGEDRGCGEAPTWSRIPALRRTPGPRRPGGGPAIPAAHPPCAAPSRAGTQHVLPVTEGGHDDFRPNAGPSGDDSCEEKPPPAYSGRCLPPPPYPAPQGGPCPTASGAHHLRQLWAPPGGSEGDGGHHMGLSCCSDDMGFNLYPVR